MPRANRSKARSPGPAAREVVERSTLISTDDLALHLADPAFIIVDARHDLLHAEAGGEEAYRRGHVPGAVFVHLDRDLSAAKTGRNGRHPLPTPETVARVFGRLGIDATRQVVAYDQRDGMFAARLWWMLRWLGHDKAAVLDGGFEKWQREGRSTATDASVPKPVTFKPSQVRPTLSATGVAASLPRHALLLLDARAAERYRGDVEPIDAVPGHIPGALNRPYARNTRADGTFRPARELRSEFDAMLHGRDADNVVHYCGSGVSACHNVLAMAVAGYPLTRLYPGSWSEWSSDPARPVAKGQV